MPDHPDTPRADRGDEWGLDGRNAAAGAFLRQHSILAIVGLAALYWLTGRLGLELAHDQTNATLVWPPTGLSLAALVLFGRWLWPGVFLGAAAVNLFIGTGFLPSFGIGIGNTLEAVVGSLCLERIARFQPSLSRVRDVFAFILIGVCGCTVISATIGVSILSLTGAVQPEQFGVVWLIWWLGDAGGALIVGPLVLLGRHGIPTWRSLGQSVEAWVIFSLLALGTGTAFSGLLAGPSAQLAAFLPFPFLAWAGARLGPRGAVTASFLTMTIAAVGTAKGHGPFQTGDTHESLMLLWAYVVSIAAVALALAAAITEREFAEARRRNEANNRRRLEQRMQQTQRLESLGLLAGGVAHDFNNILTAIRGFAELLREDAGDVPQRADLLDQIDTAVVRASELCQHLLVYAGRNRPTQTAVLIPELLGELRTLLGASISKKVNLKIEAFEDMPPVRGDAALVRQLLLNIVFNGVEAIGDRRGTVTVRAGTAELREDQIGGLAGAARARPGRFVFVEVTDTGVGMDEAAIERIFDPFFTTKFKGRGLGLASALGTVRSHAGAIDVVSTPGFGSTFRVYLRPYVGHVEIPDSKSVREEPLSNGGTVLVADDEPSVLRVASTALERAGFRVISARDGVEAEDLFREHCDALDAVLLDVTMPKAGGAEAAAAIRSIDSRIPIVLMSGYQEELVSKSELFVTKPFSPRDLVHKVRQAVADGTAGLRPGSGAINTGS